MSSYDAMPFLVLNLGGEMMYILDQRLNAQKIPEEKSRRVLEDVTRVMLDSTFLVELMRPQPLYSHEATRQIFDRIAHSSIMRLSSSSMDKLYDLMVMGLKHQMLSVVHPREIFDVTLNHLESMRKLVLYSDAATIVSNLMDQLIEKCKTFTDFRFATIRRALSGFLQDKRVKVSIFLQDGIQTSHGVFVILRSGFLPPHALPLGTIRNIPADGNFLEFFFPHPFGNNYRQYECTNSLDPDQRTCALGLNLYKLSRSKKKESVIPTPDEVNMAPSKRTQAADELNFLASLIRPTASSSTTSTESIPLSILDEDEHDDHSFDISSPSSSTRLVEAMRIYSGSREDAVRSNRDLASVIQSLDNEGLKNSSLSGRNAHDAEEDDLLDLLDQSSL